MTELAAESAGCGHRVSVRGQCEEVAWVEGEEASLKPEHQYPLLCACQENKRMIFQSQKQKYY